MTSGNERAVASSMWEYAKFTGRARSAWIAETLGEFRYKK